MRAGWSAAKPGSRSRPAVHCDGNGQASQPRRESLSLLCGGWPTRERGCPPGNAGVPPASLFLGGSCGALLRPCGPAAGRSAWPATAGPRETRGALAGRSQGRTPARPCPAMVRAGRPRSRGGFLQESLPPRGEVPPGNAGVPPASLFLGGGRGALLRPCGPGSRPFGVNRNGRSQGIPRRPCRSTPVADTGEAVPDNGAGGTPAVPGGHPPRITPPSWGSATRERGRPARILISWWRSRSVGTTLRAGSRPFGVNRNGRSQGIPRRPCRSVPVADTGEAGPDYGAGGTPAVPGGLPPPKPASAQRLPWAPTLDYAKGPGRHR